MNSPPHGRKVWLAGKTGTNVILGCRGRAKNAAVGFNEVQNTQSWSLRDRDGLGLVLRSAENLLTENVLAGGERSWVGVVA